MEKIEIIGNRKLSGNVEISGSKNATLPILAATLLTDDECEIEGIPKLNDVYTFIELLADLGKEVKWNNNNLIIKGGIKKFEASYELVKKMRASVLVLGPMVAKYGKAKVPLPGGCAIGARPINYHLQNLERMGCKIKCEEGEVNVIAKKLCANKLVLDYPSVGTTENLIMSAVLSKGETIIENIAVEPEIIDLIEFLRKMGAKISNPENRIIKIQAVKRLKGVNYKVIPDRIEAATYLIAGVITKSKISLTNVNSQHLAVIIEKLEEAGVRIINTKDKLQIIPSKKIKPVNITTTPYPGFPTDVQPMWMALMSIAEGVSIVEENVFESRFMHVDELIRAGANIEVKGNTSIIKGVKKLSGTTLHATDIRGGAALVIAGLSATGKTEIYNVFHLDRGYEDLVGKLTKLNACIKRVNVD